MENEKRLCGNENSTCAKNISRDRASILPRYPSYGIIGSNPPGMDVFEKSRWRKAEDKVRQNFHKQRFDFHEMYEKNLDKGLHKDHPQKPLPPTPLPGLWGIWQKYNDYGCNANAHPNGSESAKLQYYGHGYGFEKDDHPFFQTTSSAYGRFPPSFENTPEESHSLKTTFTTTLAKIGMPKNRSLNIK